MAIDRLSLTSGESAPVLPLGERIAAHEHWLRKVILARTGEPQAVDDVLQQVALAAIEQRRPLADPDKLAPWLHRIAVVLSARHRRKAGRGRRALVHAADRAVSAANRHPPDLLALLLAKERHEQTRRALAALPGRDIEVLLLKYEERWSYEQIAERLGITERAVDTRLVRARARLRRELLRLGIEGDGS